MKTLYHRTAVRATRLVNGTPDF